MYYRNIGKFLSLEGWNICVFGILGYVCVRNGGMCVWQEWLGMWVVGMVG